MHYVNTDNTDEILDGINSINHSLVFSTRKKLLEKMKSISFHETDRQSNHGSTYITFEGSIDSQIIALFFSTDLNNSRDKSYYLISKRFYKAARLVNLPHRDNDLPATIHYHISEDFLKSICCSYYINGYPIRLNKRDPITINYFNEGVQYFYDMPIEMKLNDIYVETITVKENIIDSGTFQCGDIKISLDQLKTIIPEVESFTLQEFTELNERLSSEEKSLIQMVNV